MLIYKIKNKINGKIYIGQTIKTIKQRWQRHCWTCTLKRKVMPISHAILKYGKNNFEIKKIYVCKSLEELNEMEKFYIRKYDSISPKGYNLTDGGRLHFTHTEETKEKIRRANTGKIRSEETKKKLKDSHLGFKVAEETKLKISIKNKGRCPTDFCKRRCSEVGSKKYVLLDPSGNEVNICGLTKFCKDNKYSRSKMSELIHGKRNQYRGWKRK